jgi:hypothetical protein
MFKIMSGWTRRHEFPRAETRKKVAHGMKQYLDLSVHTSTYTSPGGQNLEKTKGESETEKLINEKTGERQSHSYTPLFFNGN